MRRRTRRPRSAYAGSVARLLAYTLAGMLPLGVLAASPAHADEPGYDDRLVPSRISAIQNPSAQLVVGLIVGLSTQTSDPPEAGTEVTLRTFSCGNFLKEETRTLGPDRDTIGVFFTRDGEFGLGRTPLNAKVGRSIRYTLTISQPGFDTFTDSYRYGGYSVRRPTCRQINHPLRPAWSRKERTQPIVGRTLAVTPTTAPGAQVSYRWTFRNGFGVVRGRTLGTGPEIRLRREWVGRRLGVIVTVEKPQYQRQRRTLVFARVRPR